MSNLLQPQPADPAQVAGWLDRLHTEATSLLPDQFTIQVPWNDDTTSEPLAMTFVRMVNMDDSAPVYATLDPITVPHPDGTGETRIPASAISFRGKWLNRRNIRGPLDNDPDYTRNFGNRIIDGIHATPSANRTILLSELIRCVRLRQRVGETDIHNGGHNTDIAAIQDRLSATHP